MDTGIRSRLGSGAMAAAMTILGPMLPTGTSDAGPVSSAGLVPFASCEALRQWYVDHSVGQVGPYGWSGPILYLREAQPDVAMEAPHAATAQDGAVTNGPTGTNTQEAGVDEPDVAKTDGRIVVQLVQHKVVVTDVSGVAARELATWTLPPGVWADGLLLVGSHVLVSAPSAYPVDATRGPFGYARATSTNLYDLDVSVPSAPHLVARTTWSGAQLSMRQYGDTVRLVTSTGRPDLPFVQPSSTVTQAEAITHNREVVRQSTIEQWLPSVRADGTSQRSVDCSRVYHPSTSAAGADGDASTLGVYTLHPGDTAPVSSVAVTGDGTDVYSSGDRLYVWSTDWGPPLPMNRRLGSLVRPLVRPHTDVHAFALDGDDTRYVGSGTIDAQVRDRWSFDEHEGRLRVAVTWPRRFPAMFDKSDATTDSTAGDNGVVVLDEQGDRLVQVGELRGLGRDEQIQSVRWFGDLAVLVTFRQMDPLFTVDLSDPEQPRALGALELPGFSSYLHPIGGDRLLGLGTDATTQGQSRGAKVAVFDIADPAHARQLDSLGLGGDSSFAAADDPHAFTWLPSGDGTGTAITQLYSDLGSHLLLLHVAADGGLSEHALPAVGGESPRALPLPGGRVALVGDRVEVVAP